MKTTMTEPCPYCGFTGNAADATCCGNCQGPLDIGPVDNGLPEGTVLKDGEYTLERPLGRGGFAITYRATSRTWRGPVAIKELFLSDGHLCQREPGGRRVVTGGGRGRVFADYKARFRDEAGHLFRISHAHVVKVFDHFEENQTAYLVMEWIDGPTLEEYVTQRGALLPRETLPIIRALARCLERVHQYDLIHRDISPRNILLRFLGGQPEPVLIDFGLARDYAIEHTRSSGMAFTEGYSAPESLSTTLPRGPFTDLYSLAAVWYFLLTGAGPPSLSDRAVGLQPTLAAEIPKSIKEAIARTLALKPSQRPQTAREFLELMGGEIAPEAEPELQRLRDRAQAAEDARQRAEQRLAAIEAQRRAAADELAADGYRDNGDGTVTDLGTGLTWMRFALGQRWENGRVVGEAMKVTFDEAEIHVNRLNAMQYLGKRGWRLPTKDELLTLVRRNYQPTINPKAFPQCPSSYFWSASPTAARSCDSWYVNFDHGFASVSHRSRNHHVRLVRGGQ
ncbi:MAG: DUF1566 domain-containing protein [Candidatus Competibacteraceae bacterium]|nr:MAG: DUF1566 domain-containing protein [Candidatus Competibacteraceae bacterium]